MWGEKVESSSSSDCPFRLARKKERNGKFCGGAEKDFANFHFCICPYFFWGGKCKIVEFRIPLLITQENWDLPPPSPARIKRQSVPPPVRRKTGLAKLRSGKCVNERLSHFSSSSLFSNAHSQRFGGRKWKKIKSQGLLVALVLMRCQGEEEEEEIVASSSFLPSFFTGDAISLFFFLLLLFPLTVNLWQRSKGEEKERERENVLIKKVWEMKCSQKDFFKVKKVLRNLQCSNFFLFS